jgi:hypothetical protein
VKTGRGIEHFVNVSHNPLSIKTGEKGEAELIATFSFRAS